MTNQIEKLKFEQVVNGLKTKSDKIRALTKAGYSRVEISNLLGIRYQHVRNVLVKNTDRRLVQEDSKTAKEHFEVRKDDNETSWEILLKAGFQYIGDWILIEGKLKIDGVIPKKKGVYALIVEDKILYIGLTLNGLHKRMEQYSRGHKGQKTSARINKLLIDTISEGSKVKVLVSMPSDLDYNGLPINTSAGLEAGLIKLLRPKWNIQGTK